MDLFGDLPEPTGEEAQVSYHDDGGNSNSNNNSSSVAGSLYVDLPSQSVTKTTESRTSTETTESCTSTETLKRKQAPNRNGQDENTKKKKTARYKLSSYLGERQGEREHMQDAHLIIQDFTPQFPHLHPSIYRISIFGVFDGHGGVRASRFASENLHKNLRDKFPKGGFGLKRFICFGLARAQREGDITQVEKDIKKVFIDSFKKTDDDFLREATKSKPVWKDGSTALLVLIINETMYIANIGDSQAVLCRYKEETKACAAVPLSVPHNPSMYDERMRIQKHGGQVKDGRVMGVLEVSRSLGDGQYKKLGVTCMPDVKKCQLTDNDRFVIIACDGLWKCFEPEDSIKYVNKILQDETIQGTDKRSVEEVRYEQACSRLANEAVLRLSGDNVTVLLLALTNTS